MTMSLYLDDRYLVDVATTSGWGDFCRWAEKQDSEQIRALADNGYTEMPVDLLAQLKNAAKPDDENVADVLDGIIKALEDIDAADGDVLIVSDGLGDSDDGEADETDATESLHERASTLLTEAVDKVFGEIYP